MSPNKPDTQRKKQAKEMNRQFAKGTLQKSKERMSASLVTDRNATTHKLCSLGLEK